MGNPFASGISAQVMASVLVGAALEDYLMMAGSNVTSKNIVLELPLIPTTIPQRCYSLQIRNLQTKNVFRWQ
jgi:hypothetical protein